jgi:succinoglycan biosynthesis protein ExoA
MTLKLSMRAKTIKGVKSPLVSVIVPVEPEGDVSGCIRTLKTFVWPKTRIECFVVRGQQPSRQRNLAAKKSRGEWLLFLDSDSQGMPELIERLVGAALQFGADVAGGPNLPPQDEAWPGRAFSAVLASYFGSMSARARYSSQGITRLSSEKELILCNLLIRREVFLKGGGFREDLYPNEENEFLNRVGAEGSRLLYVPEAVVRRPRRNSLAAFAEQAFRYGRGRMRQMRTNFFMGDLIHLLPLAALFYVVGLAFAAGQAPWMIDGLLLYVAADLLAGLQILLQKSDLAAALLSLLLFPLRHFAYALGLLAGLGVSPSTLNANSTIRVQKQRL